MSQMKKSRSTIGALIGLCVLIVSLLLMSKRCGPSKDRDNAITAKKDTVFVTKTIRTMEHDTLWLKEIQYLKTYIPGPVLYDTLYLANGDKQFSFQDSSEDENLKLHFRIFTRGQIDSMLFSYKLKKPQTVIEKITEVTTNEVTITDTKYVPGLYLGTNFMGLDNFNDYDLLLNANLTLKNGWQLGYGYGIRQKSHSVFIARRIWPKRHDK